MSDQSSNKASGERARHEAASWVLRWDRGLSATEQDELSAWLAADRRHRELWAEHRAQWNRLDQLSLWRPEHSQSPNPDLLAPPAKARFRSFWIMPISLAAAVVVSVILWKTPAPVATLASVAQPANPIQRVLDDGTTVELDRDAELTVDYTPGERRVRLERGEAFFKVAKNPARPFTVSTRGLSMRALGTAFNVRVGATTVSLLVTEGLVQLAAASPEMLEAINLTASSAAGSPPVLEAKQQAVVSLLQKPEKLQINTLTSAEVDLVMAWQHTLLDFASVPLGRVVGEFNRRNRIQLIITDSELASIPVSASFRSDNIEGFLRLVEEGIGARVERRSDSEILLSRKP